MKINLEKISNRNKNTSSELCSFLPSPISTGSRPITRLLPPATGLPPLSRQGYPTASTLTSTPLPQRPTLLLAILALTFICSFAPSASRAQEPPAATSQSPQEPLKVSTEIVKIDVNVLAAGGTLVSSLQQQNFNILDNGIVQPIIFFAPTDDPARILVMVETGPAVYLIQNQHLTAAYALLEGLAPDDQVALVSYDQAPRTILSFTPDKAALTAALGHLQYTLGMAQLNFYDSISAVLDWIAPMSGKKALVLLTTGLDSSPPERWDALVQKLRAQDVVIFPVALGGPLRKPPEKKKKSTAPSHDDPPPFAAADKALRSLASITGGRAFFPDSPKDFVPMYQQIAAALRHEYVLGIEPQHDGKFHPLTVQVLDAGGHPIPTVGKKSIYQIFSREGYLAPGP
jgi:Ca-activated chloride channel family protein